MRPKYCYRCSGKLVKRDSQLFVCPICKTEFHLNPVPSSNAILVNERGLILLTRRKSLPREGFWDLPGGFYKFGESAEEGLVRELREELGLKLAEFKYFGSQVDLYRYKGTNHRLLGLFFVGKLDRPQLKIGDDVDSYRWFRPSQIPFSRIAFPGTKVILKKFWLSLKKRN